MLAAEASARKELFAAPPSASSSSASQSSQEVLDVSAPAAKKKRPRKIKSAKKRAQAARKGKLVVGPGSADWKNLRLDSVFLQWRLKHPKVKHLSASKLLHIFKVEASRFSSFSASKCKKLIHHLRTALLLVVKDADDRAVLRTISSATKLRDEWVDLIQAEVQKIEELHEPDADLDAHSFFGAFLSSLNAENDPESAEHPPGENRSSSKRRASGVSFGPSPYNSSDSEDDIRPDSSLSDEV